MANIVVLVLILLAVGPVDASKYTRWRDHWRTDAEVGYRPQFLIHRMDDGELKTSLDDCDVSMTQHTFSIGHRGACLQYPEHTKESYEAAALQGAGIIECDVSLCPVG